MNVSVINIPADGGEWFTARLDGQPWLGAYLSKDSSPNKITIFWKGNLAASKIKRTVEDVERLYGGNGQATFVTFEPKPKTAGPLSLEKQLNVTATLERSQAYRADFTGRLGDVTVWASFVVNPDRRLEKGGENIGICLTPSLLLGDDPAKINGPARPVVEQAISRTSSMNAVDSMITELGKAMTLRDK